MPSSEGRPRRGRRLRHGPRRAAPRRPRPPSLLQRRRSRTWSRHRGTLYGGFGLHRPCKKRPWGEESSTSPGPRRPVPRWRAIRSTTSSSSRSSSARKTMKNRFYQIPHCNGFGSEKPSGPGLLPGDEGRGRLPRLLHGVLLDLPESDDTHRVSPPGSGTTTTSRTSRSCATCSTSTALAACELRTAGRTRPAWRRAPCRGPVTDPERLRASHLLQGDGPRRHPRGAAALRRRRQARGRRASDIVYVYGSHSYLPQQFLTPLQQAN